MRRLLLFLMCRIQSEIVSREVPGKENEEKSVMEEDIFQLEHPLLRLLVEFTG